MNSIMKRKILLLSAAFLLAVIFIIQSLSSAKSGVKNITFQDDADLIEVTKSGQNPLTVFCENEKYFITEKKYPASASASSELFDSIKNIKVLGKASSSANEAEKYGLGEEDRISVSAKKDGKVLQQIYVGKNTSTGGQCYIQFAGKDTIYLASGSLNSTFSAEADSLRDKSVYSITAANITEVTSESEKGRFTLHKEKGEKEGESLWVLSLNEEKIEGNLDQGKVNSWISQIARLSAQKWAEDSKTTDNQALASLTITTSEGEKVSTQLYKEEDQWLAKNSKSPYFFFLADYNAEKINKSLSDLME